MDRQTNLVKLVRLLRLAYSGELAAAYAYQGHAHSLGKLEEREHIRQIEQEEWLHRQQVGAMLEKLGTGPSRWREIKYWLIGHLVGVGCHLCGWFIAMYGAGKLERKNVMEYVHAAHYAAHSGHNEFVTDLLEMAKTEWEHEKYFRQKIIAHRWSNFFKVWKALTPEEYNQTAILVD